MPYASETPDEVTMPTKTRYVTTVGLEVHAQLLTRSKMFCACNADIAYAPPNSTYALSAWVCPAPCP